jgi:ABC-type multidrug transport system ATPase subunit
MLLEVSHLSKSFGNFTAVEDLSFSVNEGEVYGFLGQNGAGKSTTIRMILSLIKPTAGSINIFGLSIEKNREKILQKTGAVVEKPDLYKYLTAYENMKLFSKLSGMTLGRQELMRQLAVVGLEKRANDKVGVYSQGMKQRLGIAVALVHNPSLIILDEPTNGLDPQGIADIRNLILMLSKEQNKTFLVSSHLLSEIEQIADSMVIIDKGKKIVEGKVSELLNPGKVQMEIITLDNISAKQIIASSVWADGLKYSTSEKILVETEKSAVPNLTRFLIENGVELISLRSANTLEAYFLSLTSEHAV